MLVRISRLAEGNLLDGFTFYERHLSRRLHTLWSVGLKNQCKESLHAGY